jgi:hypothetical protein
MLQHVETYHVLETREQRDGEWLSWHPAEAGMYREAYLMAYHGRLNEAIERAETIRLKNYGEMHGIDFRCVTQQRTVSVSSERTVTLREGVPSEDRIAR